MCAMLLLSAVLAVAPGPPITLDITPGQCPSRRQLARALSALGVPVVRADAQTDAIAVTVQWRDHAFRIVVRARDSQAMRLVNGHGPCDQRAAILAAVIEPMVLLLASSSGSLVRCSPQRSEERTERRRTEKQRPAPDMISAREAPSLLILAGGGVHVAEDGAVQAAMHLGGRWEPLPWF